MKILSIATATADLSVAVNEDKKIITEANENNMYKHSSRLDLIIKQVLDKNKIRLADIDRFAVAIGPGSYTGLRVGVTTVKMFASILHKEVVGISSLKAEAQAYCSQEESLVCAMMDARNDNYFAGAYSASNLKVIAKDGHYSFSHFMSLIAKNAASFKKIIFTGSGVLKQADRIKEAVKDARIELHEDHLRAGLIGQLAVNAQPVDPDRLLPRYLKRTPAEVQWHKKTGKPFGPDSDYVEEV